MYVLGGSGSEYQTDRRNEPGGKSAAPQHDMDKRPSGAAVAISKRMNRLELCMDECRLDRTSQVVAVDEGTQLVQQRLHSVGWRRNECRLAWVEVVATDPVLVGPDLARSPRLVRVTHELGLNPDDVFGGHAGYGCDAIDSELHGGHVAEHRFRRVVVISNPGCGHRLVTREPSRVDLQTLDLRGCHGFGTEQEPGQALEVVSCLRLAVEPGDRALDVHDIGREIRRQLQWQTRQWIGNVSLVGARPTMSAWPVRVRCWLPDRLDSLAQPGHLQSLVQIIT